MRKPWSIFLGIGLVAFCWSCTSIEKIPLEEVAPVIKMSKGASNSRYPVYDICIYENRIAEYQGERYTPKLGTWVRKLDDAEWSRLQQKLKSTNIWSYPSFTRSRVPDLPMVTITQYDDGDSKSVAGKENRPPAIMDLELTLDNLANQNGWTLKKAIDFGLPADRVPNQLLVQLKPGTYASNWIYKYAKQQMQILAELPQKSNYWLVGFDPTVTRPKEMENLLSYDRQIQAFEFNKVDNKKRKDK